MMSTLNGFDGDSSVMVLGGVVHVVNRSAIQGSILQIMMLFCLSKPLIDWYIFPEQKANW